MYYSVVKSALAESTAQTLDFGIVIFKAQHRYFVNILPPLPFDWLNQELMGAASEAGREGGTSWQRKGLWEKNLGGKIHQRDT